MAGQRLVVIRSIAELRSLASAWDDLWQRCEVPSPLARAEAIAQWLERFSPSTRLQLLLQLTFLKLDGRPIAFEYGYRAKSTYFSHKVGYDPAFAHLSPGQLLRCKLLERFFVDREVRCVDFWGPLSDATAKWATCSYPVGKLIVAPDRLLSRLAVRGYGALRSWWRRSQRNRPIAKRANSLSPVGSSPGWATGDNKEVVTGLDQLAHHGSNLG